MVQATSGKLKLQVLEAQLTRDTEFFGKMDPYCRITYREQVMKTAVRNDAGKHPVWNEGFEIEIQYVGDDINFSVMDKDITKSEPIAYTNMKPSSFNVPGGITEWFDL